MNFTSLDLAPDLQKGIDACGYASMTPIQELAIVPARRGRDILAIAQTGTGKTAAFAIPLLQRLNDSAQEVKAGLPRALILTPTRELAEQLAALHRGCLWWWQNELTGRQAAVEGRCSNCNTGSATGAFSQ